MNCWICGNKADSREHLIKASDLRLQFGEICQNNPVFMHTEERKNIPVFSAKTKRIKSEPVICRKCNNEVTQPFDKAWENLSRYLFNNWDQIKKAKKINLSKVFPGQVRKNSLLVHLFFLKLFGCRIAEEQVPIDLTSFSQAILSQTYNNDLYLTFGETPINVEKKYATATAIHSVNDESGSKSLGALWIYTLGNISIRIVWSPISKKGKPFGNAWNPKCYSKIVKLGNI